MAAAVHATLGLREVHRQNGMVTNSIIGFVAQRASIEISRRFGGMFDLSQAIHCRASGTLSSATIILKVTRAFRSVGAMAIVS